MKPSSFHFMPNLRASAGSTQRFLKVLATSSVDGNLRQNSDLSKRVLFTWSLIEKPLAKIIVHLSGPLGRVSKGEKCTYPCSLFWSRSLRCPIMALSDNSFSKYCSMARRNWRAE